MAHVSFVLQSHVTMDTQSKPTFVLLGHPFCLITCLFAPVWLSLLVFHFPCFLSSCFFACLLFCVSFAIACACLEQGCLERGRDFLGMSKKGKDASPKREMFGRLGGLASSSGLLFLSLFKPFLEQCTRVSFPCTLLGPHS